MGSVRSGILIKNSFVNSDKFTEQYQMFIKAAQKVGCHFVCMTNAEVWMSVLAAEKMSKIFQADFVIFWDKDILLAKLLEKNNIRIFNSAAAIEKCDDKGLTYIELMQQDICMPRTFPSPKMYREVERKDFSYFQDVAQVLGFPLVLKENRGSFGFQVYLVENHESFFAAVHQMGSRPFLMQEFVADSAGRDVRIQVVGGEMIAAVMRTNQNDFRANATNGGIMHDYLPSQAESEMALKASAALGLDFAGVDILFGRQGEPVLCEVNSNAQLVNLYRCTGIDAAQKILEYILKVKL